jgi:hypothetical protein
MSVMSRPIGCGYCGGCFAILPHHLPFYGRVRASIIEVSVGSFLMVTIKE